MVDMVEGSPRPDPQPAGNRRRMPLHQPLPSITAAASGGEVAAAQAAYLDILDCLDYTVDADKIHHSFAAIPATKIAVAYHLAKCGFRRTGPNLVTSTKPSAPPPPPPAPAPGEGWRSPPTITYEHVPREAPS